MALRESLREGRLGIEINDIDNNALQDIYRLIMQLIRCNPLVSRWLVAAMLVLSAHSAVAAGGSVVNIRFGVYPDKTRIVLDLDAAVVYRIEPQTQPDRIVIDLVDGAAAIAEGTPPSAHGLVKAVHTGEAGANSLILELAAPAHVARAQFLAGSDSAPPRIFVDLQPGPVAAAAGQVAAAVPQAAAPVAGPAPMDPITGRSEPAAASEAPPPVGGNAATASAGAETAAEPAAPDGKSPDGKWPDGRWNVIPPLKPAAPAPAPTAAADTASVSLVAMTVPATLPTPSPPPQPALPDGRRLPIVVLDAGHGGRDSGATAPDGTMEKNITLQMVKELKRVLESSGRYKVVLTREDDTFLPLRSRIDVARAAGADLFISVHADHNDDASLRGASVYTLSETASDAEAEAVAARENKEGLITGVNLSNQSPMVTSILVDLAQRETKNLSARFAGMLTDKLAEGTLILPDSHRFAGFVVLKAVDVPSVLIELGYLSNEDDEAALVSSRHRARMAKAMLEAIDRFFAWQRGARAS